MMAKRDMGEAKLILELKDGYIHMNHGEGHLIIKRKAYEGDWDKIILAILDEKGE
jgi:uncharacterized protein (DUF952 family)